MWRWGYVLRFPTLVYGLDRLRYIYIYIPYMRMHFRIFVEKEMLNLIDLLKLRGCGIRVHKMSPETHPDTATSL